MYVIRLLLVFVTAFFLTTTTWAADTGAKAKLVIDTKPSGAKIQLDYKNIGYTPITLEDISPGTHFLTLIMYGYRRVEKSITVKAGEKNKVYEELMALVGSITIKTKPPGATVMMDGSEFLGLTPVNKPDVIIGQHTLKVSLDGHNDISKVFKLKYGDEKKFILTMAPKPGTLSVSTTPTGAAIYINGKRQGRSNTSIELSGGSYKVEVRKSDYRTIKRQVKVQPGQTARLDLTLLETIQTKLSVKSKPAKVTLFLDGEKVGETPFMIKKIDPGIHFLGLSKKGYQDADRKIFIKKNETTRIFEVMKVQMGGLNITATPAEANIYLDNKYVGTSPVSFAEMPIGTHKIRISHPKYKDYIENFALSHQEYKTLNIKLKSLPGTLDLAATEKGAFVYIGGTRKGTTPIIILLDQGTHTLKVEIPGYRKHEQQIAIESGETLKVYASLEKVKTGSIEVTTEPSGAQVFIDSQPVGKTPVSLSEIKAGKHNILLNLLGYETITSTVLVADKKSVTFARKLKIKSGVLTLQTSPSHAKVEIDDTVAGYTPLEIDVSSGSHIIRILKEGYQVWESTFVIDYQEKKQISRTLQPVPGMLIVTCDPIESDIFIDGELQSSRSIALKPGRYVVRVSHEGHQPQEKVVMVGLNDKVEVSFKLEEIVQGALLVSTIPPGAKIYLNGIRKGESPANFLSVPAGKYQVKLTKEGFKTIEKLITIYKNQSSEVVEEFAPLTGTLFVRVFPPEVEIHLDNKYLGPSPQLFRNLIVGKHEVRITHEDYSDFVEEVLIEADSQSRINVNLERLPGEIFVYSSPSGGDIYVNGQFKGKTNTLIKLNAGDYRIKVVKTGYYEYYKDVTVPSGRQISLDYHLLEQGSGTLIITTTPPGAQIFLDGEFSGQTPLEKKYLKASSHSLLIIKDGHKSVTDNISLSKGENLKLNFDLDSVWGTLKVLSEPEQTLIYLDEEFLGYGPGVFSKIPVGWHRIKATRENYRDWTKKLNIKPEEEQTIKIRLDPVPGDVSIRSTPTGAAVYIKDKNIGVTPLDISLSPGPYSFRLEKEGYLDKNLPVEMHPASSKTYNVALNKKKVLRIEESLLSALSRPLALETKKKLPTPLPVRSTAYHSGLKQVPGDPC